MKPNFEELMLANYSAVLNHAEKLSQNRSDAEDITQRAFIKAFRFFDRYDFSRKFTTWMFRLVDNTFLDFKRASTRRAKTVPYDAAKEQTGQNREENYAFDSFDFIDENYDLEGDTINRVVNEEIILKTFEGLTQHQKELIIMSDLFEKPYSEIVEKLGKNVIALRNEKFVLYKRLRKHDEERKESIKCSL